MAGITFHEVTKRYPDGTEAVKHLDLEISDGEFMILVGPSGCGKSTALRMIAGLEDVSEGDLLIGGEVVNDVEPKARDIAMVFQNYALYPHMTVRQNMAFALRISRLPKAEIERRVSEAARVLDLVEHLDRKPAQLSGGQRQRVAMGRAIVRDPKAFLMDEPLSNLDAKLRVQMRAEVARIQARLGTTTVYVTHDQTEAMTLGSRVAVMRGGVIQQVDTPDTLYDRPANLFVAGFMGSPPMNLLPARLEDDLVRLPFGDVPLGGALRLRDVPRHRDVIAGIRPEYFEDAALDHHPERFHLHVRADMVESLGSEKFAHFPVECRPIDAPELDELAADIGAPSGAGLEVLEGTTHVVARLDAASRATIGAELELALDIGRMHLFDARTGRSLTSIITNNGQGAVV
jgi:multiple sugar transport system ATP-binding protein